MPLFGFADIKFDKGQTAKRGPLKALQGSDFEKTTLRYPIDVGNYDKSHYIVFYIKQQNSTSFKRTPAPSGFTDTGGVTVQGAGSAQSNFGSEIANKINSSLGQINQITGGAFSELTSAASSLGKIVGNVAGQIDNLFGSQNSTITGNAQASTQIIDNSIKRITNSSFLNTTTLTTDAIALYMPDTLQYTYTQSYDQLSLGGEMLGQVAAAASAAAEKFKNDGAFSAGGSLAKSAALNIGQKASNFVGAITGSGQSAQVGFTAVTGAVQNPMLEMIYKSPNFRTFQFDFTFYPRDEKEAYEVQRIIERIRFHQAPEFAKGTEGFLVAPSEFDIKFYYGGSENPNIPQITTCVLTTIDVNYAPNGFAAYEVPNENSPALGRTGMPVAIQMSLQFQETSYLTKRDFTSDEEFESRNNKAKNDFRSQSGQFGTS
jgi:hypothetical protein